ncbi:hypothetical protein [Parasporobacterium paucivorans]|uniref:Uncharacterized protein n=1 Tax=Parasporobacterium paucivorans DSM 15970 TaxID=1122934 RepID=A0A1M6AY92_9FIRM|nr:hypothetical protein [Parasporobacterium paucivorans]SHI41432.1 hypothetical protein SAMN02745691_00212 [Parasporobacterium paucivorans DSM 15970]
MTRSDIFNVSEQLNGYEGVRAQYKVQNENLKRICEIFTEEDFINSLSIEEKSAYKRYITPVIRCFKDISISENVRMEKSKSELEKKAGKNFEELSVAFFAALQKNYGQDNYQTKILNREFRNTIESDDWITDTRKNMENALEILKEIQYKKYLAEKEKKYNNAYKLKDSGKRVKNILTQYLPRPEWEKKWSEEKEELIGDMMIISSICYRMELTYYQVQEQMGKEYADRMKEILREFECLPVHVKISIGYNNMKHIDALKEAVNASVKGLYDDVKNAKDKIKKKGRKCNDKNKEDDNCLVRDRYELENAELVLREYLMDKNDKEGLPDNLPINGIIRINKK